MPKKAIKYSCLSFLSIVLLFSCQGPYSEKENGKVVQLSEYSSFQIELKGDPESDMAWRTIYYEKDLIRPGTVEISEEKNDSGETVKSYLFSFDTNGSGESLVTLIYSDASDTLAMPIKTYEIKVICGMMAGIESN